MGIEDAVLSIIAKRVKGKLADQYLHISSNMAHCASCGWGREMFRVVVEEALGMVCDSPSEPKSEPQGDDKPFDEVEEQEEQGKRVCSFNGGCGKEFSLSGVQLEWYRENHLDLPDWCPECKDKAFPEKRTCIERDCGQDFYMDGGMILWHRDHPDTKMFLPKRCPDCREKRKREKSEANEQSRLPAQDMRTG